ncbi:MAG: 1,4-alpha-glucan branching enzyme, partial [Vicinamibacteria bacterium]
MRVNRPLAQDSTRVSEEDLRSFGEGTHGSLYEKLGAHLSESGGRVHFAVWAPNAEDVSVIGDFNGWEKGRDPLRPRGASGVWEGSIAGLGRGSIYKYHLRSRFGGYHVDKADPFAFRHEIPPRTGSMVWDLDYSWNDSEWMASRSERQRLAAPMSVY